MNDNIPLDRLNRLIRSTVFFDIVEKVFGVDRKTMIAYSSRPRIVRARYAFYVLVAVYTEHSISGIGRMLKRDHSTISAGIRTGYPRYSGGLEFSRLMTEAARLVRLEADAVWERVRDEDTTEEIIDSLPLVRYGRHWTVADIGQSGNPGRLREEAPGALDNIGLCDLGEPGRLPDRDHGDGQCL